ncbi:hypothetical protein A3B21_01425 [Candidatus Uhrbacteria bacterium RIFCSPLOWO2_01_FULL_47_24]|uniref:Type II toxin-antitoxin system RelE/ParE family toxin n=1 Tax=Candidatus Uhrbacteria bacterium RIFCSPLOWO2_01_FULL_47_24 TaxID=1802401 RepID=A0A1F7UQF6_9BACT|nr:MAG: hypothetical protein A3D58_02800 [Candidatus Uhrbacteria bacterium RIFCSPHIGHO2_02_FULL_46_47]OGL76712.1 MAG: hypothetical protein A3F52_00425 [Candidatus Uhrbacteria bacterium RIFCSPHIGHO2_12_FULL_47_11]OGL79938.1 MAG: hypothetical protein A3B21_01425 [Candidatus Uhrbacteria bacterium RIFCSPLOWO2_01_FULL_47_24]OGL84195.1 MAG: hypothetical protein A3J03_02020 [Candidatus Uhrbacteria bacterium RIFCSPLOWO2_02_FULL_46_25]
MNIIRTDDFESSFLKLPLEIQRLYSTQAKRFRENWRDPRLHIKKVRGLAHVFSFRITRRYRVLFYFQNAETAIFFDVDHRKDVYE